MSGRIPGTEQVARMPLGPGRRRREVDTDGRMDGHQDCSAMGWKKSNQVEHDFLNPILRHRVPDRSKKELFFRLRFLPFCHHTLTYTIY